MCMSVCADACQCFTTTVYVCMYLYLKNILSCSPYTRVISLTLPTWNQALFTVHSALVLHIAQLTGLSNIRHPKKTGQKLTKALRVTCKHAVARMVT